MNISPDQLADTVMKVLNDFVQATNETVDDAAKAAASHARDDLQTTSPRLSGDYQKGWAVKVQSRAKQGGLAKVTVYNRTNYQLTHLLENGHAKVVYGHRTGGRVQPKVHIKPVEESAKKEFLQLVRSGIGK